jgi:hypothetical protein
MAKRSQHDIDEEEAYLREQEDRIAAAQAQGQSSMPYSAMFSGQQKQNLVEWQLDFKPELESIERSLRNDILTRDNKGDEHWIPNPDQGKVLLNDQGVNDVLKKIILLINKNKVLSNYGEEQISIRVRAISHAIRELIYLNYEHYGMDNDYKWNCYYSLVVDIDDMIESAYRRSLNGDERKDLNQARVVEQKEGMMPMNQNYNMYPQMQGQKRGMLSRAMPWNWGK